MNMSVWNIIHRVLTMMFTLAAPIHMENVWIKPNPRYLPFPQGLGNKIQIITGFGVPVDIKSQSLSFGLILKTNYELPTNLTIFTEIDYYFRRNTSPSRWALYKTFEAALARFSLGGRDCLLLSICQAADATFGHDGILGEILHLLLMPSASIEEEVGDPEYLKAEEYGKLGNNCNHLYPDCTANFLDIISVIREEAIHNEIQFNY